MRIVLIILTLLNLWLVNNRVLIIYPSTYEAKKPSVWLEESPHIRWLMENASGKISGLDFPFYCGHWVKLKTLGYMGGFRTKKLNDYLGGVDGTNKWGRSLQEAKEYGVEYFIEGNRVFKLAEEVYLTEILVAEDNVLCGGS